MTSQKSATATQALLQHLTMNQSKTIDTVIAFELVESIDDPNAQDEKGYTLLTLATCHRQKELVEKLLSLGADPNKGMHKPLDCAAWNCLPEIMAQLIVAGADPDHKRPETGLTALMGAAWQGNADCVQLLLDAGADIDAVSSDKKTAMDYSQMSGVAGKECNMLARKIMDARVDRELAQNLRAIEHIAHKGIDQEMQAPAVPQMKKKHLFLMGRAP